MTRLSARHRPLRSASELLLGRSHASSRVMGPGDRSVLWAAYCPLRCRGCIAPELQTPDGGTWAPVEAVAAWVIAHAVDGLTLSGGEPMAQAQGLAQLVDAVRAERGPDFSVMLYTGYRVDVLRRHGDDDQRALLARASLVKDGPYVEARHGSLLWRASANQRLLPRDDVHHADVAARPDTSAGLEIVVERGADGLPRKAFNGVPAAPGFRAFFDAEPKGHA